MRSRDPARISSGGLRRAGGGVHHTLLRFGRFGEGRRGIDLFDLAQQIERTGEFTSDRPGWGRKGRPRATVARLVQPQLGCVAARYYSGESLGDSGVKRWRPHGRTVMIWRTASTRLLETGADLVLKATSNGRRGMAGGGRGHRGSHCRDSLGAEPAGRQAGAPSPWGGARKPAAGPGRPSPAAGVRYSPSAAGRRQPGSGAAGRYRRAASHLPGMLSARPANRVPAGGGFLCGLAGAIRSSPAMTIAAESNAQQTDRR